MTAATDLDAVALQSWLRDQVPVFSGPLTIDKFPGGQSNPTYRLSTASGDLVLRRKPFGTLLPSAHAVDREYRLLAALHPTGFPVPRPVALCEDEGVIGAIFYVMELIAGRSFWDGSLPQQAPAERRSIYEAMIATLAQLHGVDVDAAGLADFGRPGNYFARQIDRWTRQYRAAQTDEVPAIERLIYFLPRTVPPQTRSTIIHGDYRIDNLIFAPDAPQVAAVLDWELATIGDPLADFAYLAMNWILPADSRSGLAGLNFAQSGLPTLEETVVLYCAATGRDGVPDLHWYFAYNLFRLTSIVQGIKKRMLDGTAASARAEETVARLHPLANAAWAQACVAGAE